MTQTPEQRLKDDIADALDRRRAVLAETDRVVSKLANTGLRDRVCAMAVPMIYAQWEGFTKEALRLYVEFVEGLNVPLSDASASLLAYAWGDSFRKLTGSPSRELKMELIDRFLSGPAEALAFDDPARQINMRSNLKFAEIQRLSEWLCLDIEAMRSNNRKLDAFVHRRNNIGHGGREPSLTKSHVDEDMALVLTLMEQLELALLDAVDSARYLRTPYAASTPTP